MLKTKSFDFKKILEVISSELDRYYFGIELSNSLSDLSKDEFISYILEKLRKGYKFLIFAGRGELKGDIPAEISTRLKNRIHREIYISIHYYKDGIGVIEKCCYCDRKYKSKTVVMPQNLTTVFFEYDRYHILETINRELDCDFTDVIFITDNSIDINNIKYPLCGNV